MREHLSPFHVKAVTHPHLRSGEDTVLPLATPIKSTTGHEIKEVPIPKGTFVHVAIDVMNRSKLLFGDDASEFKPERWLGGGPNPPPNIKNPCLYSSMSFIFFNAEKTLLTFDP